MIFQSDSEETHLVDEMDETTHVKSNLCCYKRGGFSVQSGDIQRIEAEDDTDDAQDINTLNFKERLLHRLHQIIYKVVKRFFSNVIPPVLTLLVILVLIPVGLLLMAIFVYPPQLDLSLRSFQIPNHESSLNYDAFQMALRPHVTTSEESSSNTRHKRYLDCGGSKHPCPPHCTPAQSFRRPWALNIFYVSRNGSNIVTKDHIEQIHNIEQNIVKHRHGDRGYEYFCHKSKSSEKCDPLNSLLTFFYPTCSDSGCVYDGNGLYMQDVKPTLAIAFQFESSYWYGDFNNKSESRFLRSQLRIGVPTLDYCRYSENSEAIHKEITDYFISFIPYLDSASTSEIEVLYGGTEIFDYEIEQAINHDKLLALVSLFLVIPLVFVLSGFSLFSTVTAIATLASCFPIAFFFYRVVFGIKAVGLLNVVSLFVIIGIGVDDVFVFLNTFKQADDLKGVKTLQDRLAYTVIHASKATFLTSATTAVAFLANTLSAIPAVHQFGLFMGLVVMFCYVQVTLVMPSFLYLWQKYLSRIEYLYFACCLKKRNGGDGDSVSSGEQDSTDSGIVLTYQYLIEREPNYDNDEDGEDGGTTQNHIPLSVARQPDNVTNLNTSENEESDVNETSDDEADRPVDTITVITIRTQIVTIMNTIEAGMKKMTAAVQWFVLKFIARPVVYARVPLLGVFALLLIMSVIVTSFLKPSDKAPQFLDSDSNIQKLLELESEVSQQNDYDCWNCSAFFIQQKIDNQSVFPTQIPSTITAFPSSTTSSSSSSSSSSSRSSSSSSSSSSRSSSSSSHQSSSSSAAVKPSSTTTKAIQTTSVVKITSSHINPTPTAAIRPTTSTRHTTTTYTRHTNGGGNTLRTSTKHGQHKTTGPTSTPSAVPPPSICSGNNYDKCVKNQAQQPAFGGGAIVYVVFGISGIERTFSPSHVIPQDNNLGVTQFDSAFQQGFQICPRLHVTRGVLNALCHICKSFSNSTLVKPHGAYCFPSNFTTIGCSHVSYSMFAGISECDGLSTVDSTMTAKPIAQKTDENGDQFMLFMAMAFKSTTDTNASPFAGYNDYVKWNDFLDAEMTTVKKKYGDEAYQVLKSAFHTSEYWVTVNTEVIAVYGAIYGIIISFLLCMVLITFLSRNWRILISMFTTIIGILFLLMAFFKAFGWSLGIVEAVTLSIIVGNSLDYCIHLTQAYQDVDHRHLALLHKLGFTNYGIRSQKVIAGMVYIGVSIISSAITTFLATLPLLGTKIQLFKKFGEILVLDTAIAILYTILFCSSMLTFIGPKQGTSPLKFQLITISVPLVAVGLLVLGLFIASRSGVDVPSPLGGYLFQ